MSHLKLAETVEETESLIKRFEELKPEDTILLTCYWEPNGSQCQWSEEWVVSDVDNLEDEEPVFVGSEKDCHVMPSWESGELCEDSEYLRLKLFREIGKVHHYQEWRPVKCHEAAKLLISEFTGDESFKYNNIEFFADWLETQKGIDCDTDDFKKIMVIALREIADQIERFL